MISSLLFLGTGASLGVPIIGCSCEVCRSRSPYNRRTRSSALLKIGDKRLLIDVGPDFKEQALRHQIVHLDALFITHPHQDHVAGIDELRVYSFRSKLPLDTLSSVDTAKELRTRFGYMFRGSEVLGSILPLNLVELEGEMGQKSHHGVHFHYFTYYQSKMKINGFRFGNLAYVTDIKSYTPDLFRHLQGVETLIISAQGQEPSHMHLTVEEAAQFSVQAGAKKTYLTHLSHAVDYENISQHLPEGIFLAYDGLEIPFIGG